MTVLIEINNLTKDYETGFWRKKKVRALDDLSLEVKGGQIFGFLGGNGAGKTTSIKILMSLLFPTSGTARILGYNISSVQMHNRIGYCPENPYFYDYLTASELMSYFGELFGYDALRRKSRSEELLSAVGLEPKDWNKQLRKFSKGMLQRVALAQSLINEPELLFLDEPMSGLDPIGRRQVRELIESLRDQGTTVFMSTHILSDVEALCDEVAILRKGKLAATGKLDDLLERQGETQKFEIHFKGVDVQNAKERLNFPNGSVVSSGTGITVTIDSEKSVGDAISSLSEIGAKLISVQPVRLSLEELFVEKTVAGSTGE
jgi:ABC-2 type transport system ATP-binding protein